jgi:hypothetical protein
LDWGAREGLSARKEAKFGELERRILLCEIRVLGEMNPVPEKSITRKDAKGAKAYTLFLEEILSSEAVAI